MAPFYDKKQLMQVIHLLVRGTRADALWDERGPTTQGVRSAARPPEGLSVSEVHLNDLAWEVWNLWADHTGSSLLWTALIEQERLRAFGALLMAMTEGPRAVEHWLDDWQLLGEAPAEDD